MQLNVQVSVIIVNYNVYNDILDCIKSIYRYAAGLQLEIIVVDNNSADRSIENLTSVYKDVQLIQLDNNGGFGAANNAALKIAKGNYLLLVNPDIIFVDNTIEKLAAYLESNSDVAAAGPVQSKPNEGTEYYYSFFPSMYSRFTQEFGLYERAPLIKKRTRSFWDENILRGKPFKVDWVIGSCLMTRRTVYEKLGGFTEAFFLYEEEVEWQYRMKNAGWSSMILPDCRVIHNHHSSTSKLGVMFILYHEFRSRIIFSALQYSFPLNIIRKLLTLWSITFRAFFYSVFKFGSANVTQHRLHLYADLFKMIFWSNDKIVRSRFVFSDYINYFSGNGNAKL